MNSKSLRRLAADHASLHTLGLPPNYLFPSFSASSASADSLTSLDVLLAGPTGTPYYPGLFKLHLEIPPNYPTAPPTAHFRTRIFHPNIDPGTGAVCVETLKREWRKELTLRDVLVTITCLLVVPNSTSALNADAGRLVDADWGEFCRRAAVMVGIYAPVPGELEGAAEEARRRGEEQPQQSPKEVDRENDTAARRGNPRVRDPGKGKSRATPWTKSATDESGEEGENSRAYRKSVATDDGDWIPALPAAAASTTAAAAAAAATPAPTAPLGVSAAGNALGIQEAAGRNLAPASLPTSGMEIDPASPSAAAPTTPPRHPHTPLSSPPPPTTSLPLFAPPTSPPSAGVAILASATAGTSLSRWRPQATPPRAQCSPETLRRRRLEAARVRAAGGCWKRYNRGVGGVRRGIRRL